MSGTTDRLTRPGSCTAEDLPNPRGDLIVRPLRVLHPPDLVVATPGEITSDWRSMRRLKLCVEVISPSSARADRLVKRRAYQEAGVETYWVVDPDHAVVEVWRPGDEVSELATRELEWRVTPGAPLLAINLERLFSGLPG